MRMEDDWGPDPNPIFVEKIYIACSSTCHVPYSEGDKMIKNYR